MNKEQMVEISKKWYIFDSLPAFDSDAFSSAAASSAVFVWDIAKKEIDERFNGNVKLVVDKNVPTAYINLKDGTIGISASFFTKELYEKKFGKMNAMQMAFLAVALINGCIVHESLHAAITSNSVRDMKNFVLSPYYSPTIDKLESIFTIQELVTAYNIFEDLYIENHVSERLESFLQVASDFFFTENDVKELAEQIRTKRTVQGMLNLAILYKNKNLRNMDEFEELLSEEQLEILHHAATLRGKTNSVKALSLSREYLLTLKDLKEEEIEESEESKESGSSDEDSEQNENSDDQYDIDSRDSSETFETTGKEFSEIETEEISDEDLNEINDSFDRTLDEVNKENKENHEFVEDYRRATWKNLEEVDVLDYEKEKSLPYLKIEETGRDYSFLQELLAKRTLNRVPGRARNRGSVMVKSRMTRIATDGKIFAKNETEKRTLKRAEIIINVDLSGSTYGSVGNTELTVAYEMSKALRKARIAHSVYGHTSKGVYIPLLIHIFSYDMKTTNTDLERRFKVAEKIRLRENYDGVIFTALREKFTGKNAEKYIISLSDGIPHSPTYMGSPAANHTKKEIETTRKQGIAVFSISVVSSVVYSNDSIYGKKFNINGSVNLGREFKKLLSRIF